MGRKSTAKAKEKKQKRKEESARISAKIAMVEAANAQVDPMSTLLPFKKFERNGLSINISCQKANQLDQETVDWAFELTKRNMQSLYEESEWGWSDRLKREELTDDKAWYLLARDVANNSEPVAMVHFRFDMDNDDEVLYCYEIQLSKSARRKGLGKFLMQILELMAFKAQMKKVMLTTLKGNHDAQEFFKKKLKYEIDETSPDDSDYDGDDESCTYEILSKRIGAKKTDSVEENGSSGCGANCHHHH